MINVLVVDDSAFMRTAITKLLENCDDITVIGTAKDGFDALEKIEKLDPDIVTLDIEMPRMDGLTCLKHIMAETPRPVIMVSSLTSDGAEVTLKALDYGAVDFIAKPQSMVSLEIINIEADLQNKIRVVAKSNARMKRGRGAFKAAKFEPTTTSQAIISPVAKRTLTSLVKDAATLSSSLPLTKPMGRVLLRSIVAIGVSTGGPPAVQKILTALPENFPVPIVIAQHMPAAFTGPFARRLDGLCAIKVKEAEQNEIIKDGVAYIAPGGIHMRVTGKLNKRTLVMSAEPKNELYKPSANVLLGSVGEVYGGSCLGVILTGMGSDGLYGATVMKDRGGKVIAQDEDSCVVYGMPKAVLDAHVASEAVDIDNMAAAILNGLYR